MIHFIHLKTFREQKVLKFFLSLLLEIRYQLLVKNYFGNKLFNGYIELAELLKP